MYRDPNYNKLGSCRLRLVKVGFGFRDPFTMFQLRPSLQILCDACGISLVPKLGFGVPYFNTFFLKGTLMK